MYLLLFLNFLYIEKTPMHFFQQIYIFQCQCQQTDFYSHKSGLMLVQSTSSNRFLCVNLISLIAMGSIEDRTSKDPFQSNNSSILIVRLVFDHDDVYFHDREGCVYFTPWGKPNSTCSLSNHRIEIAEKRSSSGFPSRTEKESGGRLSLCYHDAH